MDTSAMPAFLRASQPNLAIDGDARKRFALLGARHRGRWARERSLVTIDDRLCLTEKATAGGIIEFPGRII